MQIQRFGVGNTLVPVLTSQWGPRINPVTKQPQHHNGVDISVPVGTAIVATLPGKVISVIVNEGVSGTAVVVDHRPYGFPFETSYVHLSAVVTPNGIIHGGIAPNVAKTIAGKYKGTLLAKGQLIGLSGGKPGEWGAGRSTGPHLHFIAKRYDSVTPLAKPKDFNPLDVIDWGVIQVMQRTASGALRRFP